MGYELRSIDRAQSLTKDVICRFGAFILSTLLCADEGWYMYVWVINFAVRSRSVSSCYAHFYIAGFVTGILQGASL